TQCPDCQQFKIFSSQFCFYDFERVLFLFHSCAAGCCLIPFCMDNCKNITHRCPKCRSTIHTIKKL
uniref:LITAF domain-containing protein n=1 Tax=Myripristis murdjan TaxID=586833 RepID=A0A668AUM6_9TELE